MASRRRISGRRDARKARGRWYIKISPIRSGELDITLGIQQLVDVAVRALSTGVNDPHTAVQAINFLSALFGHLAYLDFIIPLVLRAKNGTVYEMGLELYARMRLWLKVFARERTFTAQNLV